MTPTKLQQTHNARKQLEIDIGVNYSITTITILAENLESSVEDDNQPRILVFETQGHGKSSSVVDNVT